MATGAIFQIITNDGKQDRMLMATALLHDRLDNIWRVKKALNPGLKDDDVQVLPSLIDIEKTHILFTNAHFKPFAAIGFEYNKVRSTSGTPALGQVLQFSIPQFGDFFHDMAFHCILTQPTVTADSGVSAQNTPAMRWTNWPGERLLKKVQQEVNGNPLDEYTYHVTAAHREYRVAPNKLTAWKRCVGQEEPEKGFVRQCDWDGNGTAAESFRLVQNVHSGNQTPSASKSGKLEMFIPLLFWYNKDVRLAVPSVAIPYGQRFINIELASASELVGLVPRGTYNTGSVNWASPGGTLSDPTLETAELYINNIFVNPEVHKIYIKRVGFSLIRVHRQQVMPMTTTDLHLQQLKWPIEYLFVGAKNRDYFAASTDALKRKHLQNWDKYCVVTDTPRIAVGQTVLKRELLTNSTATLGVAVTGAITSGGALASRVELVHGDTVQIGNSLFSYNGTTTLAVGTDLVGKIFAPTLTNAITASTALTANAWKITHQGVEVQTKVNTKIFDTLSIQAHGIDLYKEMPAGFFNAYTTYHYGGPNVNAPEDVGSLFVPFCLYPGTYQPSGHINVSRAREFYVKYTSKWQDDNPSDTFMLVVIASAINFLLISDGSAVLRYST